MLDFQDYTVAHKTFEITQWPQPGWRQLDPGTGDEAMEMTWKQGVRPWSTVAK